MIRARQLENVYWFYGNIRANECGGRNPLIKQAILFSGITTSGKETSYWENVYREWGKKWRSDLRRKMRCLSIGYPLDIFLLPHGIIYSME